MEYAGKTAFIRINVNERPDYADEFGVSVLPTMFFISGKNEEGYVKQEISGFTEKERLRESIDLEIEQSEQNVICDTGEDGIPEDANHNSNINEGKANSNVLSSLSSDVANAGNYELLIIAPDEFIDELKLLKDFKDATGRPTILLSLSEIYSNPSCTGVDAPEKIKKCIAHYEKSTGIKYVMLVGDVDKLPVRWRWWGLPNQEYWGVSELYYADLYEDGTTTFDDWDFNDNKLYGEIEFDPDGTINNDRIDFLPDVALGRIPASTAQEVTTYVHKIVTYELNPTDTWFKRVALYTGCVDGWDNWNKDVIKKSMNNMSFTVLPTKDIRYSYWFPCPTEEKPDKKCCDNPLNMPDTIINDINSGVGFVDYIGHGNAYGWEIIHNNDLAKLNNSDKLPIVFAAACDTGMFARMARFHPYWDVNGTSHCGTDKPYNESLPPGDYSHVNLPKPAPLQSGKISCYNQKQERFDTLSIDRPCFAETLLFGNPTGSPTGAIAYLGERTGGKSYARTLDIYFFKAYEEGYNSVLGDMWKYMMAEYYKYYDLENFHTLLTKDSAPGHVFDEPQKMILFGDPSLAVGGLDDKKMTITHDTTLYPTTHNTPEGITINASNVVLDCNGAIINGTGWGNGINVPNGVNNVTIKNCNIKNYQYGIQVGSNSNMIISNNIYSNEYGIYLLSGVNNNIISNDIYSNGYGISLINADSNEIRYNTIKNNDEDGVYLDMYSSDNNLISNTICSNSVKDISNNVNYGGPNYGDENTCSNVYKWNDDGAIGCTYLCEHTPTLYYCDSCSDCTNKINTAPPGSVIKLTKNIINHQGTCIKWMADGKTFDGQNHAIDGDDSTGSSIDPTYHTGIDMSFGPEGNTIKNCVISDFEYGIAIRGYFGNASYYNNIINNILYSNVRDGININLGFQNDDVFSTIKNNVILNNGEYGIGMYYSTKNLIDSNIVCSNTKSDFFLSDSYNNFGTNNYCNKPDGWNDAGETGCSNSCSKAPVSCAPGEVYPYDDMEITSDTKLCRGFYNIPDSDDKGVIIIKSDNVVLDCNGATINGDGSGIGIYNNGFDNVILKNCNIKNYEFGIGAVHSSYSTVTSNNISSNSYGIDMEYSSNNTLNSNNIYGNNLYGVYMAYSSGNALNNNKIKNNRYGVSLTNSNNADLNANIICENTISDLDLVNSYDNSGNNNYCDTPDGWNDTGTTGCTNPCAAAPICAPDEVIPYDGLVVTKDTKLCHGFYNISDLGGWGVIYVKRGGNVVLDCNGATLNGTEEEFTLVMYVRSP
jgi:parallel beta-helix repeat protein